ncbi:uncharacterized protein LOC119568202 [Penaeus monodon]|uniref:uncharacterized protein LOC119568202 n=1 Tax=Penaeus monodon TaxID=6687 RepID=UPI0018A6F42F|nr:uncharacterized protein LOC119568202 [Penaeus monodon]
MRSTLLDPEPRGWQRVIITGARFDSLTEQERAVKKDQRSNTLFSFTKRRTRSFQKHAERVKGRNLMGIAYNKYFWSMGRWTLLASAWESLIPSHEHRVSGQAAKPSKSLVQST